MNAHELVLPAVGKLTPYIPGKPVSELERELGIKNIDKLASNENPLGSSPLALAAVRSALDALHLYPDGSGFELKAALAHNLEANAGQITLGNGSNDVLELVARAFLSGETAAVYSEHAFAVYPIVTQAVGAEARIARAGDGVSAMRYGHDLGAMLALIDRKVRVVFIANPNNPTGTWLRRAELADFLARLPNHVIVVIDEAYFEYVDEPDYPDALQWLPQYPNLVVTRTFSKAYGLAGLRVGYAVSSPEIADYLNRVRQPFNVNSLALAGAAAALDDGEHLKRTVRLNAAGLLQLSQAFEARGLDFIPSVGNFVTVDVNRNALEVYEALLRAGVIVRPVANYGLPGHLRVSVGTAEQNNAFLDALDRVLA
ncbi:histidinol-phosphate transaminase [Candidatus Methylospira mobilis]|uniref:Histidinol-phosphate aminotransferase n=1 Tax=Candidatus Methylospira mobilis TaxID=1808979 RepID=A0A5Q0BKC8_9GAMM|nr:histidinol-phosphate transaminase [Candidatus Methylospira mobilis]QFY42578.1 histidinol-phosphate transaminase [Candidatus Methylospira mobilis]WNV04308.1 histidinol-phosphate transaminase [Candidatus Methylospira mobilis]